MREWCPNGILAALNFIVIQEENDRSLLTRQQHLHCQHIGTVRPSVQSRVSSQHRTEQTHTQTVSHKHNKMQSERL